MSIYTSLDAPVCKDFYVAAHTWYINLLLCQAV